MTDFSFLYIHKYRHVGNSDKMKFHSSVKLLSLALLAASILTVSSLQEDAFAIEIGMEVNAVADEGSSTITISGHTASKQTDITIKVTAPNGNVIVVDQFTPGTDGDFFTAIQTEAFTQDGTYTISLNQGDVGLYKFKFKVEVSGGVTSMMSYAQSSLHEVTSSTVVPKSTGGLTITALADEGSTTIGISGHTERTITDITIIVTAPNGNVVTIAQVSPDANGDFMKDIETGGPLWSQDGDYRIKASQNIGTTNTGGFEDSVTVEIVNGVIIPEFGTIAGLILAIAIISIIAVSAKTRIGIIPKY